MASISYGVYKHEWVYWPVRRRLLVEEWLDADRESGLVDYKFHMSRGRCFAIQVNEGFQTDERTRRSDAGLATIRCALDLRASSFVATVSFKFG